ncbi:MAG: PAS domain S-box protein [Deltaproteobacteria bacterium]|nr:PAS domain S-box protein [Deltaproteobacteria bacterium]
MNEKILIVDDEPEILDSLETILADEGFEVTRASSGNVAVEIFEAEAFGLVITDMKMPGLSGLEVLRHVKQIDEDVEVIILTGHGTIETAIHALKENGAYDYLRKPLEGIDDLIISVAQALERRKLHLEKKELIKKLEKTNAVLQQEIEERKQAEEALKKSEERYRSLFQNAPDAYYVNDLEGNFVDGNKAAEELTGYQKEELIGKNFFEVGLLPEDQLPKAIAHLEKNNAGQPTGPEEFILIKKNGEQVIVEIRTLLTQIGNKDVVLGIARDLTNRKHLEEQLLHLHKMKAIAVLAGGVSHEFNNALMVIIGNIELLEKKLSDNKTVAEHTAEMRASYDRMANLTNQLLAYARRGNYGPRSGNGCGLWDCQEP